MPRSKHSARKQVAGGPARPSRRGGSDDSQEEDRPRKRAARPPSSSSDSSSEGLDFEDELEEVDPSPMVGVRAAAPKPRTRRPTFQPPPPPVQPHGDARHISIEPPLSLGRHVKRFNEVPKASYLKLRRDVDQFTVVRDSQDSRFRTNVQADIFTTIVIPKGLSLHVCIDLEHIRTHPEKYPGAIELIESSNLAAPFAFQHDFNHAAIHQFYATCYFAPDNTVTWMTSDTALTASYAQFVTALGFPDTGFKIHKDDPNHKPKGIAVCADLLRPISSLSSTEKQKGLNQVSIWRFPFNIIYQCVIRTIYPKMGDKGSCSSYCIDLMHRLFTSPKGKINVPHFLWHEIRLASFQHKRAFPHAPFLQAFIESVAPFPIARTHIHERWVIPPHMAADHVPPPPATASRTAASFPSHTTHPPSSDAPFGRIARFLGKAHSAMMKMFTYHCSQHHDVVTRMVTSKNALKARLRDSGVYDVSDDERLPADPPSDFGFPSGPEWADFFDEAGGSGVHDDDDEDDL